MIRYVSESWLIEDPETPTVQSLPVADELEEDVDEDARDTIPSLPPAALLVFDEEEAPQQ